LTIEQLDYQPRQFTEAELTRYARRIQTILNGKDPQAKKNLLRGLIAYIDVERQETILKGTIYIFTPDPDDPLPTTPTDTPEDPTDDVPPPHTPSGPPSYRHIIQYHFVASTKRPR
jgi:hypothetical protein